MHDTEHYCELPQSAIPHAFNLSWFWLVSIIRETEICDIVLTARCTVVQSAVLRLYVVRPSVCLSVTLVDQDRIGWKSWKLIARTISPTPSLFVAQRAIHLLPGERGEIWGD